MGLQRDQNNLGMITTSLFPGTGPMIAPAQDSDEPSFPQTVSMDLTINVTAPIPPVWGSGNEGSLAQAENVGNDTGLILWLTNLGIDSVYRMGILNGRKDNTAYIQMNNAAGPPSLRGFNVNWIWAQGSNPQGGIGDLLNIRFTYQGPIALPYSTPGSTLDLAPALGKNFSDTQIFAGIVQIEGNSTSVGAATLAGTLTGGVISDTRGISFNESGNETTCFSPAELIQQTMNKKDAILLAKTELGLATILGPDIPQDFTAPEQGGTDTLDGEFVSYSLINYRPNARNDAASATANELQLRYTVASAWVTPWPCVLSTDAVGGGALAPPGSSTYFNVIRTAPIDESGVLDVKVSGSVYFVAPSADPSADVLVVSLRAEAVHVFASLNSEGNVVWAHFREEQTLSVINSRGNANWRAGDARTSTGAFPANGTYTFEPRMFRPSFKVQGKYMGTYVTLFQEGAGYTGAAGSAYTTAFSQPTIQVRARGINKFGRKGPCRVLRWDKQTAGQMLVVTGAFHVSCVPTGNIASFVSSQASHTASETQMRAMLSQLYNGPCGLFKRMWTLEDYKRTYNKLDGQVSHADLSKCADQDPDIAAKGAASGLFSAIGGTLGSLADGFFGGRSSGDAAGQFSRGGDAAGQFSSGASYGSSAGRFLQQRRDRDDMLQ
jgi:hypothetical protein